MRNIPFWLLFCVAIGLFSLTVASIYQIDLPNMMQARFGVLRHDAHVLMLLAVFALGIAAMLAMD